MKYNGRILCSFVLWRILICRGCFAFQLASTSLFQSQSIRHRLSSSLFPINFLHSSTKLYHAGSLFEEIDSSHIRDLPIYEILDSIRDSVSVKQNLLLEAAPGAGKTTVVPLLVSSIVTRDDDDKGIKKFSNVLVVEPRRVATRSAAQRMAKLVNQPIGGSVGYAIRGESKHSSKTQVMVMTDGILLNKLRDDPELNGIDCVILDEFHERGVNVDTALALLREVQINYRPDLSIIVMSATLLGESNTEIEYANWDDQSDDESMGRKLMRVLGGHDACAILTSEGRQYPVAIQQAQRSSPPHTALLNDSKLLVETTTKAIEEGLKRAPSEGDILVFLPGAREIRRVVQELRSGKSCQGVDVLPLYGTLPKSDQDKAIFRESSNRRRVIVSSPIAEASLTIEGVTCVVDCGLRREPRYDANTGLPRLVTVRCSKDSVLQRTGRAGRTQEGLCIRLFSTNEFNILPQHDFPEIQSTDLVPTLLFLSEWGCTSSDEIISDTPFVDPPPRDGLKKAYEMLVDLGALKEYKVSSSRLKRYQVTEHGKELIKLSTHPRFASSILKSVPLGRSYLAAAVITAALFDEDSYGPMKDSNISLRIKNVLNDGQASFYARKLEQFASRISIEALAAVRDVLSNKITSAEISECVGEALLPGFIDLIAQYKGDASYGGSTYMLSLGQSARLDNKRDEGNYVIVVDTTTGDDGKTRIRAYSRINPSVLAKVSYDAEEMYTVPSKGYEVRARKVSKVGSLVLSSSPLPSPSSEEITEVLVDTIDALGGISSLLDMQSKKDLIAINELRQRLRFARKFFEDIDWPSCFASLDAIDDGNGTRHDEDILMNVIEPWLSSAGSLKKLDLQQILTSTISPDQRLILDDTVPINIQAPDGSNIRLDYMSDQPVASGKLQQFFGAIESPAIGPNGNKIPISLSLLSPSGKLLAQTIDLPFFWKETYPSVRAEMRGRYPKHPWPEDPMTATATRLTKKQQQQISPQNDEEADKKKKAKKKRGKKRR